MTCTDQTALDWRNSWRSYCNNNYISTGYINNGASYIWNNLRVDNLGSVQIGSYWYIRVRITWPWGYVETVDWWECWGQWRSISSTTSSDIYDARYNYVNYSHGLYLFCDEATTLAGGRIQLEIGYINVWQNQWLIDMLNGNDNWEGLNWDYPKKTLTAGATSVQNNKALWIASGDYTVAPGITPTIAPTNLANGGQITYEIKDPRNTGIFQFSCGERVSVYIGNIVKSVWGQITKWYKSSTDDYEWVKGLESSLTTLVSSDILLSNNRVMRIIRNNNTIHTSYVGVGSLGNPLILDEDYPGSTWRLAILSMNQAATSVEYELRRNGEVVDSGFFGAPFLYQYYHTVDGVSVPIINLWVEMMFDDSESRGVTYQGCFQLSSYYTTL